MHQEAANGGDRVSLLALLVTDCSMLPRKQRDAFTIINQPNGDRLRGVSGRTARLQTYGWPECKYEVAGSCRSAAVLIDSGALTASAS